MIRVVKRNGRIEALDVSKIQKYTSLPSKGSKGSARASLRSMLTFISVI